MSEPVEVPDLAALRATAQAATPGPWQRFRTSFVLIGDAASERVVAGADSDATAAYIATFDPPTIAALLDRLEAAEQRAEELRAWLVEEGYTVDGTAGNPLLERAAEDVFESLRAGVPLLLEADEDAPFDFPPPAPHPPTAPPEETHAATRYREALVRVGADEKVIAAADEAARRGGAAPDQPATNEERN